MNKKTVKIEIKQTSASSYPVVIGEHILPETGAMVKEFCNAKKVMVVTNPTVFNLFGEVIKKSLEEEGFVYDFTILEDGEKFKNSESLNQIWTKALEFKLERKDAFVALGGGVIGDITGFAASTYLRGIDFVQIPTTLLAQVDSSVGGKVAINHPLGKNMIGAFYQPKLVITDINTLKSLPEKELKTGLAEVLKYGFIEKTCGLGTDNFINFLKTNKDSIFKLDTTVMTELVKHCCELKASVVNQDEKESGLRAILNFGHTIGHAIEKCTNYSVFTHGEAVAIGMKGAFLLSRKLELISYKYFDLAYNLLKDYGLRYQIPESLAKEDILAAMMHDKKVISSKKRFILPTNIAEVEIFDNIKDEDILDSLYLL